MLRRLFLFLAVSVFAYGSLLGNSAADALIEWESGRLGVSLGSDAYLINLPPGHRIPRDITNLPTVLVPPGTLFLVFIHENNRITPSLRGPARHLALSEFGDWMYIPSDASNLVRETEIMHMLQTGTEDLLWHIFPRQVRTSNPSITITPSEKHKVRWNADTGVYIAYIERDDPIMGGKFGQIVRNIQEGTINNLDSLVIKDGVVKIPLDSRDIAFHFPILVENIEIRFAPIGFHRLGASLGYRERYKLLETWPKTIWLDTLLEYGCDAQSVEHVSTREETLKTTLRGGVKFPVASGSLNLGIDVERITRVTSSLKRIFALNRSVSEAAFLHGSSAPGATRLMTFGEVAECEEGTRAAAWRRMHWEGRAPHLFDRDFFELQKPGLAWNREAGVWEIDCFYEIYDFLHTNLSDRANNDRQVRAFLTRSIRPSGTSRERWIDVFKCTPPSPTPAPTPRPAVAEQEVSLYSDD